MKLHKYSKLRDLNNALGDFERTGIQVAKVKLLTEGEKNDSFYYILTDEKTVYHKAAELESEELKPNVCPVVKLP